MPENKNESNGLAGAVTVALIISWALILFILTVGEPDLIDAMIQYLTARPYQCAN